MYENYPLWHTFFTDLGFRVELSPRSNKQALAHQLMLEYVHAPFSLGNKPYHWESFQGLVHRFAY
jgi:hypothetical protein